MIPWLFLLPPLLILGVGIIHTLYVRSPRGQARVAAMRKRYGIAVHRPPPAKEPAPVETKKAPLNPPKGSSAAEKAAQDPPGESAEGPKGEQSPTENKPADPPAESPKS